MPKIRPIKDVVDMKAIKDEIDYEYAQLLAKAKPLKANILIIPHDPLGDKLATPSLLSLGCVVAMIMKLKMGLIGTKETLKRMAEGIVIHRHYEAWFRDVNKDLTIYTEMALRNNETVGVPDIVYCSTSECGLIELKSTWQLTEDKRKSYVMQMSMYYDMLREFNITEAYIVTMNKVDMVPIRELESEVNNAKQLLKDALGDYPKYPPNPKKCVNCILKPVCPSYKNLMDKLLFNQ